MDQRPHPAGLLRAAAGGGRSPTRAANPNRSAADFEKRFVAFLAAKRETAEDVEAVARAIVADVRARGDAALIDYTAKFDRQTLAPGRLAVTPDEIAAAEKAAPAGAVAALVFARDRIEAYHRRQLPTDERYTDALGVELGARWTPIDAVGLYVPGGTAAYPSSVLMNAVPAKVAGVGRIVMTVPSPGGGINPLVLAAARMAGVVRSVGDADLDRATPCAEYSVAALLDHVDGFVGAFTAAGTRTTSGSDGPPGPGKASNLRADWRTVR